MKRTKLPCFVLASILPAASVGLSAEATDNAGLPEKVVELSPFVVSSDEDRGYQALSTLAGTRLNTPIEDIGASISIYTKDFLNDIGATSANELMIYATGMEASGAMGNYSGYESGAATLGTPMNEEVRTEPQSRLRTRGLANPSITRGFFLTDIRFDSYNTDRVTVNRGPNAILFGVGNPAGIVDTSLARADVIRNRNKIELRYGSHDSLRTVLDVNRVLIDKKLAARVIGLRDRKEYMQRPAFEEDKRFYGALTFEPFRSTSIRASVETGRTNANRPHTILPTNAYAEWEKAGRVPFDWTQYDDPARTPNAQAVNANSQIGNLIGGVDFFGGYVVAYSNPAGAAPDIAFLDGLPTTTGTAANALRTGTFHPTLNRDLGTDSPEFWATRYLNEIPAPWWPGGVRPDGLKRPSFLDYSVFDWRHEQIDQSDYQDETFNTFNIAIEQRAWGDRVGVEVAYDHQKNHRRASLFAFSNAQGSNIRIDPNVTLPTGEPNPNLGRPFIAGPNGRWRNRFSEREAVRVSAFMKYDFKELNDSWGKWLGRHVATGLFEHNAANTMFQTVRLATAGPAAEAVSNNITSAQRRYWAMYYLGPSVVGNNNPVRLEAIRAPRITPGPTISAPVFVRQAGTEDPGHFEQMPMSLVEILDGGTAQRDLIKSQAVSLQSYWLRDHLITLFGWRRDEDYFQQAQLSAYRNAADLNDPGKAHFGFDDFGFRDTPPINAQGEIKSYGAVLKWPKRFMPLPGTDLSLFYNESENFTPAGDLVDAFNNPLGSPRGETQEFGFNLSLFNRKLTVRMNWFETAIVGQSIRDALRRYSHEILLKPAAAWATEGNRNPENVAFMNAAIAQLISPLPSNYLDLRNWTVSGTAPNIGASFTDLIASDTTNFASKGVEVDVIYNPTRNWRILFNLAKQETVETNIRPLTKAFRALMDPVYESRITDPVSGISVAFKDIPVNGYPAGFGPANPPTTGNTFGDSLRAEDVTLATLLATEGAASAEQRNWRANLVTNYDFGRTSMFGDKLRGWNIGGGLRWQGKYVTGYPVTTDSGGVVRIHIESPYYAPGDLNVDAWIGYKRKIWQDRINWKVQLNGSNLIGGDGLKTIAAQPSGEPASVRLPPERRWFLTNTFEF